MKDIIIIGSGPAGMTAALYALRSGLSIAIIEQGAPGGMLLKTEMIENYPGFEHGIGGMELANNMYLQIQGFDTLTLINDTAKSIRKKNHHFEVITSSGTQEAKSVILATGGYPRSLNVPGEREYAGKGVSYCAICDGFFFRGKTVAVVGGGNTALEDALYLASIAKDVYLIHRRKEFRASKILQDKLAEHTNLHLVLESVPKTILGETKVNALVLEDVNTHQETTIELDGVFVAVGQILNSKVAEDILMPNDAGQIPVNEKMETDVPGLFACGDVIAKHLRQVSTAVGDGAVAGQMAYEYISNS